MSKDYSLTETVVPPISRATVYERVLDEFVERGYNAVKVDIPKKKPATIHQGLLKQKRMNGKFKQVNVIRRGTEVFLAR